MLATLTTFLLAAAGSLVWSSVHLALKFVACRTQGETFAVDRGRAESAVSGPPVDPVLKLGCILTCYGAVAVALVSALPGALAVERTLLAFACMCVGGLVGEIANTGATPERSNNDVPEMAPPARKSTPLRLSVALMLVLNLAFAVLSAGQGLIEIVPPADGENARREPQLDPIVVVAQRTYDPTG